MFTAPCLRNDAAYSGLCLLTSVNLDKCTDTPTGQRNVDNLALRFSSQVILGSVVVTTKVRPHRGIHMAIF